MFIFFCSPPNLIGVGCFLSPSIRKKNATPAFGYCNYKRLNNRKFRGEQCSSALRRISKKIYRYLKCIFNKKILFTIIIFSLIFSIYTALLEKNYENFYAQPNKDIEIEAVIISEKNESEYYNSYRIEGITKKFKNKRFILYLKKDIVLEYGDKIKITGEFYKPEDSRNYKGFSYKEYLQTEKIYGTIKAKKVEFIAKDSINTILKLSNSIRNKLIEQTKKLLPKETETLLIGLTLGQKEEISDEIMADFQKSSLAHILAISRNTC